MGDRLRGCTPKYIYFEDFQPTKEELRTALASVMRLPRGMVIVLGEVIYPKMDEA